MTVSKRAYLEALFPDVAQAIKEHHFGARSKTLTRKWPMRLLATMIVEVLLTGTSLLCQPPFQAQRPR
jgi:hypothetical protein